ncbi:MAG: hypothetical protein DMG25_19440, partial [Acidobacteria bacterium]
VVVLFAEHYTRRVLLWLTFPLLVMVEYLVIRNLALFSFYRSLLNIGFPRPPAFIPVLRTRRESALLRDMAKLRTST